MRTGIGGRVIGGNLPRVRLASCLAALLLLTIPLRAADWISLRSEHFQLHGNAGERDLRVVALRLEQFREAITRIHPNSLGDNDPPVVALIFRDNRSFRPFMPRVNGRVNPVTGVFLPGQDANYIALSLELGEDAYPGIFHEFSHYLLRGTRSAPVWFNEGLAEYYSTFEVTNRGRSAHIGRPHEKHIAMLRERRLPMTQFFGITRGSAEYTRDVPDRIVLYAQSWLLVHHAFHGEPRRGDQVLALARRMAAGGDLATSLRETYGMSAEDLDRELQAYVRRPVFQYTNFDFTSNIQTRLDARATPADDAELDARLGGLAASLGNLDEASPRLERALKSKPDAPYVHASMAILRIRQGRGAGGAAHMRKSIELRGGMPPAGATQLVLTENEARERFPELIAKLEASRPRPTPTPAVETAPSREPMTRLLLAPLKEGEQATLGTLEAIECRAGGITVVLRSADGVVRANAASLAAVNLVTFRSNTESTIACGKQPPAYARLISRRMGASLVAVGLELLPDGYVP